MSSPEIFYIHVHGKQRGPYTIGHIDHLLNSGLIDADTLFWREGLEQWEPVTRLVVPRQKQKRQWSKGMLISGAVLFVVLAVAARVFGPITVEGWRETNQREFTELAAYWRARDYVRNHALPSGAMVMFEELEKGKVELRGHDGAGVLLRGELTERGGQTRAAAWQVEMHYDPKSKEWTGSSAREAPAG